jgi:hypothetical protein
VPGFSGAGCFLSCHDTSRHMPRWKLSDGKKEKFFPDDRPGVADLWHMRLHRAALIGASDDQYVRTFVPADDSGRKRDAGGAAFGTSNLVDGHPQFVIDPSSSGGRFAVRWNDILTTPFFYRRPSSARSDRCARSPCWSGAVTSMSIASQSRSTRSSTSSALRANGERGELYIRRGIGGPPVTCPASMACGTHSR